MSSEVQVATGLSSTVTLNDGVVMPMFGLGTYMLSSGGGGAAETITSFAIQNGYRLIDTATFYGYTEMKRFKCQVGLSLVQLRFMFQGSNWFNQCVYDKNDGSVHSAIESINCVY